MELSGRLGAISLAELLQWPHNDRRSGAMVVRTSRREKRVLFERGLIVGCQSTNGAEFFGRHLLLNGYLERQKLLEVLSLCRASGARLGSALVDLGLLAPAQVEAALRAHVCERVCDLFLWDHGVFFFQQELPASGELLQEPLDPVTVALEGSRWIDELARIRELLVHDGIVVAPGRQDAGGSTVLERRVLEVIDSPQRLDHVYEQVQGSYFRFLETVYGLLVVGKLEVEGLEEANERGSGVIELFDLMLEQAAEEEVLFSSSHLSLPLEWLDRFFPLWVEDGADSDAVSPDHEFHRSLDGSRSLRQLLNAEPDRQKERMEMVLVQLQQGRLALLPRPVEELRALGKGARNPWLRKLMG